MVRVTRTLHAIQAFAIVVNGGAAGFDSFLATMPKQPLASRVALAFLAGVCAVLEITEVARRYEVPVLSADQLRSYAQEFGREVHA